MSGYRPEDQEESDSPILYAGGDERRSGRSRRSSGAAQPQLNGYPQHFVDRLNGAITTCVAEQSPGALLVLSIENLPMIINAFGMDASESVMRHVEECIGEVVGQSDVVYRIQRDQFGIIIQQRQADELEYLAQRLCSHIQQWCSNNDYGSIHVISLVATVRLPEQAKHAEEALSKSYMALHDRSMTSGAIRVFEERHEEAAFSRQEMALANYLSQAIAEDRLLMAYQPIVASKDGAVAHYEALLRIRSDDGQISSAGALIPIAERMGLINIIDQLTFKMTVDTLRNHPDVSIAFNISNLTTRDEQWLELFQRTLSETPEIAPRLIVEITETAAQQDLQRIAYFVAEIQSFGCMVALDDFGSGYTSFRQLKTLSVDMVKIDGAFIKDLIESADNRFFVKTLLDFTNGFGLKSVAEFVENGEIAKLLIELGVDMLQGYYFGRPVLEMPWDDKPKL